MESSTESEAKTRPFFNTFALDKLKLTKLDNINMRKFLLQFQNEDWIATIMGLVLVLTVVFVPWLVPKFPSTLDSVGAWQAIGGLFLLSLVITTFGATILGEKIAKFIPAFLLIFGISLISQLIAGIGPIKKAGLESVLFAVAFGLLIRNTVGLPKWMKPAVRSEYYIKIGLVLLGTTVLFGEIISAGALGMVQGIIVVLSVWYFTFWLAKKLKVDEEMGIMLASAVSICGVSAAIATCGAIKGDNKKLSFVVSIVMVVAVPMIYIMPLLAKWLGLSQEVAGAWLGGTIDTTGAVVASGKFIGETAEKFSVIIKSSQNVLLGVAAFAISLYWSFRGTSDEELTPSAGLLWERFPKFVVGFIVASLIFSFGFTVETAKTLTPLTKGMREVMFSLAFVCIGLETDFRDIFKKENKKNITTFMVAQGFNIVVTLIVAAALFGFFMK